MRISTLQKRVRKIVSEAAIVQAWSTLHNKTSVLWGILERGLPVGRRHHSQ